MAAIVLTNDALRELIRLSDEATAAPWSYDPRSTAPSIRDEKGEDVFWEDSDWHHAKSQHDADFPLTVAARNAVKAMALEILCHRSIEGATECIS